MGWRQPNPLPLPRSRLSRVLSGDDPVPDADRAAFEDVRADAGAVDERAHDSGAGQPFQVGARLREALCLAGDLADREAAADERVQVDPARDDVPPRLLP